MTNVLKERIGTRQSQSVARLLAMSKNGWIAKILFGGGLLFIISVAFASGGAYVTVQNHVDDLDHHPSIEQVRSVMRENDLIEYQQRDSIFDLLQGIQQDVLINRRLICDHMTDEGQRDSACRGLR